MCLAPRLYQNRILDFNSGPVVAADQAKAVLAHSRYKGTLQHFLLYRIAELVNAKHDWQYWMDPNAMASDLGVAESSVRKWMLGFVADGWLEHIEGRGKGAVYGWIGTASGAAESRPPSRNRDPHREIATPIAKSAPSPITTRETVEMSDEIVPWCEQEGPVDNSGIDDQQRLTPLGELGQLTIDGIGWCRHATTADLEAIGEAVVERAVHEKHPPSTLARAIRTALDERQPPADMRHLARFVRSRIERHPVDPPNPLTGWQPPPRTEYTEPTDDERTAITEARALARANLRETRRAS